MNKINKLVVCKVSMKLILLFFLNVCFAGTQVEFDDLVIKNNFIYLNESDNKYTGKVIGLVNGSVQNGLKEGKWTYYSAKNKIHKIITYKKGIKNGLQKEFYENNSLKYVGNSINGKKNG